MRRRARGFCPILLLAALCCVPALADGGTADEGESRAAAEPVLTETVTVTATRLPSEPEPVDRVPGNVTILDRDRIERAGVRTVQDLLALESGVVLYDQVGNDVQKTLDLRGFAQGTGTRVFLDGAPVNDTRSNGLQLDLIPLNAVERIEIHRGSAAALAGGGAEAGVIHLLSRREEGFGGSLSLAGGTFDSSDYDGEIRGGDERFDFFLSGSSHETDGFRENAGGEVRRLAGTFGARVGGDRRLSLSIVDTTSDLGNPGSLTADELAENASSAFNRLDYSDEDFRQASVNFGGSLTNSWSLAANIFFRDRESEILTTFRNPFLGAGGSYLKSEASAAGSTVQVTHRLDSAGKKNRLVVGLEWLDGETDGLQILTPEGDPGFVDPTTASSDNTTERRTSAIYVQELWSPLPSWTFLAGARADRDRIEGRDTIDADNAGSRRFSEVSLRGGANWQASEDHDLYVSYGEAFLPPTAEQLFAFPPFNNADLDPQDSRSYEIGYRGRWARDARLDLSLFQIDTEDEILFVFDGFSGRNENAGQTRRRGIEASFRGRPVGRVQIFANLTLVDAEFRNGPNDGNGVPLVPRERLAAGVDVDLPGDVTVRIDGLFVGAQVVDSDPGNLQDELASYTVANARVTWGRRAGLRLFAEARNLLDEDHSTRAIFAGETFFTPAPGRRYLAGGSWLF